MAGSQNSDDLINTTSDTQSYLSVSAEPNIKYKPLPDPLSVYVPLNSLNEETINSIVSTLQQAEKTDWNHSKRTLLAFLLAINEKVSEIESNKDSNSKFDEETIQHAAKVRQWLIQRDQSGNIKRIDWSKLRVIYDRMAIKKDDGMARHIGIKNSEPYYELTINGVHPDIIQSREYMARFRSHGWESKELKIYWNAEQLENLCPKHETKIKQVEEKHEANTEIKEKIEPGTKDETTSEIQGGIKDGTELETKDETKPEKKDDTEAEAEVKGEANLEAIDGAKQEIKVEVQDEIKQEIKEGTKDETEFEAKHEIKDNNSSLHDPSDADAVLALRQYPVSKRDHDGTIVYVNKGIESAVFDAPEDVQLIVLNFANERSAGGGYLRHAWAQEEIILFNSDGYRALLDLKYGRMGGGYAIPEFGLAYVRDIRFFHKETGKERKADMLVSACYCLSGSPQLYDNPKTEEEWITKNVAKFRAFIAAAVANTIGDGSNTYLLLGPIGTGAFGNDVNQIGYVFRDVLSSTMMGSNGPIRKAFRNIWFVSTDKWKNDIFEAILDDDDKTTDD